MSYLSIQNLYKAQEILLFKECFAMEKIHGTSTHISWRCNDKVVSFFAGGESHNKFVNIFDSESLTKKFEEVCPLSNCIIYGEGYGGKQQGMSATYGKELKFIAFDVKIEGLWLSVPDAENVCKMLGLEFVDYVKVPTDLDVLNHERDKDSVQAVRNGCGEGKKREGVVLRPLIELTKNNGDRIISKHKRDEFIETKTPRVVNPDEMKILDDAKAIAEEWCTEMRLIHVLDKLPQGISIESTKLVIDAMVEDIYREAKGEIVESKEVIKFIGGKAATMFKKKLQKDLEEISKK